MKTYDCPNDGIPKPDRRQHERPDRDQLAEELFNGFTNVIANLQREHYLQGYVTAMRKSFAEYQLAQAMRIAGLEHQIADLEALDVRNIMVDVVPGPDGMGHEVYATSVSDVVRLLTDLGEKAEEVDSLRAQVAAQVPVWVSVTERLPEKNTEVLIAFAGQNTLCSTGQYTGSSNDVHGWCYPWENRGATDSGDDPVVTHWMPLPTVPATTKGD